MSEVVLYRRRITLASGTGPLMHAQALELAARGVRVSLAAARGHFKFFFSTGHWVKPVSLARAKRLAAMDRTSIFVDHSCRVPGADLCFVHNLEAPDGGRDPARAEGQAGCAAEAEYFRALRADAPIVANSSLVKDALMERYGLASERIGVCYPGYRGARFAASRRPGLRAAARRELRWGEDVPLIGLVTSGDFKKRGLDVFMAVAAAISAELPKARFLVVGSRRLPEWAERDALLARGALSYRPKHREPERWLAALDLLLYPAAFEEFGLVVTEAQALGVPVLTSRRVGASETLPEAYDPWLLPSPDAEAFAAHALRLIASPRLRSGLAEAALASVGRFEIRDYACASADMIVAAAAPFALRNGSSGRARAR